MKKGVLLFLLVFVILLILGLVFKEFISASIFDTFATFSPNITVVPDTTPPDLIIVSPTGGTTYPTTTINLEFSVSDSGCSVDSVWYNLNNGTNYTATNTTFTVAGDGSYVLYMFANDGVGNENGTEFVSFSVLVDSTPPGLIVDSPTNTTYTTSSVDIKYSVLEPESSVDTVWYNLDGESNKTLTANITRTLSDGSYNFYIYANNTAGLVDSESVSFTVNVPTPPGPTGQAAGGGGGGGGAISKVSSFEVDKSLIKVSLKQGETKRESLSIKNTGDTILDVSLDLKNLQEFVIFPGGVSTYNLRLGPGEEQTVQLVFNIAKDKEPGVYPGQITVRTDSLQKLITTIVEVESEKAVFDVEAKISPESNQVLPGESVSAEIKIFNLLGRGRVDVVVEYGIQDLEGNVILSGSGVVAVETQMSFVKSLIIPFNMKPGNYVFYIKAKYDDTTSTSSDIFEVTKKPGVLLAGLSTVQIVLIAILCLVNLFIILALRDIFIHLKKERKEREERPQEIAKPEKEKELKERKPIKVAEILKEEPEKVEGMIKKEKSDLKKLIDHVRKNLR